MTDKKKLTERQLTYVFWLLVTISCGVWVYIAYLGIKYFLLT